MFVASPASSKLGLRMTTLHEEPSTQRPLAEEPEDSYSDPEYAEYETYEEKTRQKSNMKTRLSSSKTMGSLTEIGNSTHHSTNMMAYTSNANVALKHIVGTPSMSSSASSGYGSQVKNLSKYFKLYFLTLFFFLF